MTEDEIKTANWIIRTFSMNAKGMGGGPKDTIRIAKYLVDEDLIKFNSGMIFLTPKGEQFQKSGKSYADYLDEKRKKAERDELHKDLQIKDLEIKLKSVEEMQERQKVFWESGIARDNRQKWQFWITWFLSGAAFLMGIFNLIKDLYIK